jgi:F420H(2)-dependent quinone reductase
LCTLDAELAAVLEPGAQPPNERLSLVEALAAAGIDVGIMIAPWIPGVTDVAAFAAAAGPARRITISPLKCNASGAKLKLAGRTYVQQTVNRLYREERERFRGWPSLKWEAPWQLSDHYSNRYLPLSFEQAAGVIRSPEPAERWRGLLRLMASSRLWRCASRVHATVYRLSGGRVGHRIGRRRHLLLTTWGRRSGRPHVVVLSYFQDGPRWVVMATNAGADRDPVWLLNLRADANATVRVGRLQIPVKARPTSGPERFHFVMRV